MKRYISFIMCILLLMVNIFTVTASAEVTPAPTLVADSAVLINAKTGEVLFDKNKDMHNFPASTTKVMTALLALENLELDQVATISHNASYTEGSRLFLLEGEQLTVEQLLYGMMLESANDAAIALAETVAGDVDSFADMMNERAKELGAVNTNFETPNGLPNDDHVTTAYDLALIAQEAMKNETFRKIVSTYAYTIPGNSVQPETRNIHNTNKLLFDSTHTVNVNGFDRPIQYEGILGIKTGYTSVAQSCLIAGAERDGVEVIGVIMHSDPNNMYTDMISLLDFGFSNYSTIQIVKAGEIVGKAKVGHGSSRNVDLTVEDDILGTVEMAEGGAAEDKSDFSYTLTTYKLSAPVEKGTKAGTLTLYHGSQEAATYDLVTAENVELSLFRKFINNKDGTKPSVVKFILIMALILLALYGMFVVSVRRKHERERAKRKALREERRKKNRELFGENQDSDNVITGYDVDYDVNYDVDVPDEGVQKDDDNI